MGRIRFVCDCRHNMAEDDQTVIAVARLERVVADLLQEEKSMLVAHDAGAATDESLRELGRVRKRIVLCLHTLNDLNGRCD